MMSLKYQNYYDLSKSTDKLNEYYRLEGLDPLYTRSTMRAGRSRLLSGVRSILGSLFGKEAIPGKRPEPTEGF